jgi:hypothetical protein
MIMCRVKAQGEWHAFLGGPSKWKDSFTQGPSPNHCDNLSYEFKC